MSFTLDKIFAVMAAATEAEPTGTTAVPLALLPVRIETRFVKGQLWVRVYPDEIHLDRRSPDDEASDQMAVRLLPHHFTVVGLRDGHRVLQGTTSPVAQDLDVGPSHNGSATTRWLTDFDAAVAAGMALRLELDAETAERGLDQLLVFGVGTHRTPEETAAELQALLEVHRETSGLSFVEPGTPTNNTPRSGPVVHRPVRFDAATDAATPASAPVAPISTPEGFGGLVDHLDATPGPSKATLGATPKTRAFLAEHALGLAEGTLRDVPGASAQDEPHERAMNTLLWGPTWGYALRHLARRVSQDAPMVPDAQIERIRSHFVSHVRGGGPLPSLRVGRQIYGMLPVLPLDLWASLDDGPDEGLVEVLRAARPVWRAAAQRVPHVTGTGGAEQLTAIFGMRAVPRAAEARPVLGRHYLMNLASFLATPTPRAWFAKQQELSERFVSPLDLGQPQPRWLGLAYLDDLLPLDTPLATAGLAGLANASPRALDERIPSSLLDLLARHALLLEYGRAAATHLGQADEDVEPELVDLGSPSTTLWDRLREASPVAGSTLEAWLHQALLSGQPPAVAHQLAQVRSAALVLSTQPPEQLDRLVGHALSLASHRLDAWLTSLATRRLHTLRARTRQGVLVGAYGWVTDLRPRQELPTSDGHLLAPSLDHATTATLLRSAHRVHGGEGPFGIDLSSARVRTARRVLEGVRAGQPLGALLGYRLERALQREGLHEQIFELRRLAPLSTNPTLRAVVDGHRLLQRHREEGGSGAISSMVEAHPGARRALDALAQTADAIGDVLLAEAVHQMASGDPAQAAASLDALAEGRPAPATLEVTRTPRHHDVLTSRLVAWLPVEVRDGSDGYATEAQAPTSSAAPALDRWAARLLGPAQQLSGEIQHATEPQRSFTVADLGLGPLELVAHAQHDPGGATLRAWARWWLRLPPEAEVVLGPRLDRALTVAAAFSEVLAVGRGAEPAVSEAGEAVLGELQARATTLRSALAGVLQSLQAAVASEDPTAAAEALVAASRFGMPEILQGAASVEEVLQAVLRRLQERIEAHDEQVDPVAGIEALVGVAPLRAAPRPAHVLRPPGEEPSTWLLRQGQIRRGAQALVDLELLASAHGTEAGELAVHQEPWDGRSPWAGGASAAASGTVVEVAVAPEGLEHEELVPLFLDEWVEARPAQQAVCGLSFHFDAPAQEPPQAILLALAPDRRPQWDDDALVATLTDTLELATLRMVDAEGLDSVGQLLPATYLAFNDERRTVSASVGALHRGS